MSTPIADQRSGCRPRLRLLPDPIATPVRAPDPYTASLATAPFRPGELPLICWLPLDEETRKCIAASARAARLPAPLWVRIAVETSRLKEEIAARCMHSAGWVQAVLDETSRAGTPPTSSPDLDSYTMSAYAAALSASHSVGHVESEMPLPLPEDMTGAWRRAARQLGLPVHRWVAKQLADPPVACVAWEIAASRSFQTLAEWAYASSLMALARSSA